MEYKKSIELKKYLNVSQAIIDSKAEIKDINLELEDKKVNYEKRKEILKGKVSQGNLRKIGEKYSVERSILEEKLNTAEVEYKDTVDGFIQNFIIKNNGLEDILLSFEDLKEKNSSFKVEEYRKALNILLDESIIRLKGIKESENIQKFLYKEDEYNIRTKDTAVNFYKILKLAQNERSLIFAKSEFGQKICDTCKEYINLCINKTLNINNPHLLFGIEKQPILSLYYDILNACTHKKDTSLTKAYLYKLDEFYSKKKSKNQITNEYKIKRNQKTAKTKGLNIYPENLVSMIDGLKENPDFQQKKYNKGKPDWQKIADYLNPIYGISSSSKEICGIYHQRNKKK